MSKLPFSGSTFQGSSEEPITRLRVCRYDYSTMAELTGTCVVRCLESKLSLVPFNNQATMAPHNSVPLLAVPSLTLLPHTSRLHKVPYLKMMLSLS